MTEQRDPNIIEASPTKEFFIYMLVKDIGLRRAILDLIDNSIDGARRLRVDERLDGLWVRIEIHPTHFKIMDNCGGIPVDIARQYAFRFGRPTDMEPTRRSIGQFGMGMKRAIFKLGTLTEIESITKSSRFLVEVDVDQWKSVPEWEFQFKELEDDTANDLDLTGTKITVKSLHLAVANEFTLENFITQLRNELESAYSQFIAQGLSITLNGIPVDFSPTELLSSNDLRPAFQELSMNHSEALLTVKMFVGIGKSEPQDGGWYIYCNGRLVLGPDQTNVTGWGEKGANSIPKYHNQFARFRGYVFFDSDEASRLPWNTTKTGVDSDSPQFKAVRQKMLVMARPVIDFLNDLDREKDSGETQKTEIVESAKYQQTFKLFETEAPSPVFKAVVKQPIPSKPREVTITYRRTAESVERIKKCLNVTNNKDVGEKTFDYYLDMECSE